MINNQAHVELYVQLKAAQGALDYERRYYDNGEFTRTERKTFLWRAAKYAHDVRQGLRSGALTPAQASDFFYTVAQLPITPLL